MGFLDKLRGKKQRGVNIDAMAARASAAGIDGTAVREILQQCQGADGTIDWQAAADMARERGLDVQKLRSLMR